MIRTAKALVGALSKLGRKREIYRKPGELYLTRYYLISSKFFSVYVHKFHVSDFPVPHDHPWNFIAIPLIGGYYEHLPDGSILDRKPFRPKFRTANEFHWVEKKEGVSTWSLFVTFRRRRNWGFMTNEGWVDHEEYNKRLGVDEVNTKWREKL